jgi:thiol-disulfide isomerase/thioredoxin
MSLAADPRLLSFFCTLAGDSMGRFTVLTCWMLWLLLCMSSNAKLIGEADSEFPHSAAMVDLHVTDFDKVLSGRDSNQSVLLELYASWCPACRMFAPDFVRVAEYLATCKDLHCPCHNLHGLSVAL